VVLIDIIWLILLVAFFIKGYKKGFLYTILRLLGTIIALVIATQFSGYVTIHLFDPQESFYQLFIPTIGFLITFFVAIVLVNLGLKMVLKPIDNSILSPVNKLLGGLIYGGLWCIIFGSVLWLFQSIQLLSTSSLEGSYVSQYLIPIIPTTFEVIGAVWPVLKSSFEELNTYFEQVANSLK